MAKPKPGGRRPCKRERKNVTVGVVHIKSSFNNTIVIDHRHRGQRHLVGVGRERRLQGFAQVARRSPPRWPPRRQPAAAMEHGVRRVEVQVKGPGSGRDTAIRSHAEHRHRGHRRSRTSRPCPTTAAASRSAAGPGLTWLATPARRCASRADSAPTSSRTTRAARRSSAARSRPGAHGRTRRRNSRQRVPRSSCRRSRRPEYIYGVLERQFRRTYEEATRLQGVDGREPAAPARAAPRQRRVPAPAGPRTRPQARQFVNHGLINVNGKRVNIAELPRPQGRGRRPSAGRPAR